MVRKVKFLCSHSTYREVLHLLDSASLKTFPLVDSKGNTQSAYTSVRIVLLGLFNPLVLHYFRKLHALR